MSAITPEQLKPGASQITSPPLWPRNSEMKVFVQGKFANTQTRRIFAERGYSIVETPQESDMIVWTGGEDIYPGLYGEKPIEGTYYNAVRDNHDIRCYKDYGFGRICIGICRGAQLLNVMNKGKLWQDIDKHEHGFHEIQDKITGEILTVNSIHHQQMILPDAGAELVAFTNICSTKFGEKSEWLFRGDIPRKDDPELDPEVVWFGKTNCLCFQGHPEFGHKPTTDYFFSLLERYCSPFN